MSPRAFDRTRSEAALAIGVWLFSAERGGNYLSAKEV